MNYCIITRETLSMLFDYNPITGIFTNISDGKEVSHWKNHGYLHVTICGTNYKLHRLAFVFMNGTMPLTDIDHINHIRDDNRWINLREACVKENNKNLSMNRNNQSGVNGVSWSEARKRWCVYGSVNNKTVGLGRYKDLDEAIAARRKFDIEHNFHTNHGKEKV